jgi:DNA modification methylase
LGGTVLDPFMGSGTTAQVAQELGREWVGIELNEEYRSMQDNRTSQQVLPL